MDYYKKGNVTRAEEIKAAFEKLGCDTTGWRFDVEGGFYYTHDGRIDLACGNFLINLIKTHPDYKELPLPVKPKFNDGDVLVTTKIRSCPFIYRKTGYNNDLAYYYAGIDGNGDFTEGCLKRTLCHFGPTSDVAPATKEQCDLLFQKMKEAGYQWDADKKELRKIKPHYDISNFYAGMPVLVRDSNDDEWNYLLFSHYRKKMPDHFFAGGNPWYECIPFEGNDNLLGTTDMCDEQYINW